jgi:hypothetical protein
VGVDVRDLDDGRQELVYGGDPLLRRGRPAGTDPVWLAVPAERAGETFVLPWSATVERPAAWGLRGELTLRVADAPVAFDDLRDVVEGDDEP